MQRIFVVNIPSFQFKMVHLIISRYGGVNLDGINLDWTAQPEPRTLLIEMFFTLEVFFIILQTFLN